MATWTKTRLAVVVDGDTAHPLTPIDSFSPTFALNTEVVHSIEATHVGWIANPDSFTFSLSVKAIGGASARLTQLALEGREFSIGLYKQTGSADEWDFSTLVLTKCLITSASPSNATVSGAPVATFSGISRHVDVTPKNGPAIARPTFTA
ncbi:MULTISPECIES: hypothetical protein [Protofrankia]|uniref:Uncharacterized protein n=2 Tax=Protofrankia TaxID=2994361 RepID=F8B1L0_9ACTN|nr:MULTISPECIES: hypothetical protein [Protofrankia]AEH10763.1 hypothetical protein FsymDg_3472 [Candidatus Protofrankia datiscae]KLL09604.1 hypothetical protein FrCorBMG51_23695 [Protofrankia coriariae]ONH34491.1 hypothetical protein BL254_15675 [Protofrankia sp. BMG5.30]